MQGAIALGTLAMVFLAVNVRADFQPEEALVFQPEVAFSSCVAIPPDYDACQQMARSACRMVLAPTGEAKLDDYCG